MKINEHKYNSDYFEKIETYLNKFQHKTIYETVTPHFREEGFYDIYDEPTIESCLDLWRVCLRHALYEALYSPSGEEKLRREAQRWIINGNRDFSEVCYLAGYHPVIVREYFLKIFNKKFNPQKGI